MQERQRELIDAHIVVFPIRARHMKRSCVAFHAARRTRVVRDSAVTIYRVRQAETRAFPFAGLREQMRPGDRAVVRCIKAYPRHANNYGLVRILQQSMRIRCMGRAGSLGSDV